jgi:Zn finger protein HypA/HybF involved in hydrogenase expression
MKLTYSIWDSKHGWGIITGVFGCKRCEHVFNMTDESRREFKKNGGRIIGCPKCGSTELKKIEQSGN